jgi:hypothetical protein
MEPRTVWLSGDQRHGVGRPHPRHPFRGPSWAVPAGERGSASACTVRGPASPDAAVLVQFAHRLKPGAPLAAIRLRGAGVDRVVEVRAEPVERSGWQRAALRFPMAGGDLDVSIEALGNAMRIGSVALWPACGRPVWVIAHMSNSPALVGRDVADGANAVECDVGPRDGSAGGELAAFHRFAPPYLRRSGPRTPLPELLAAVAGSLGRLAIVMLDVHLLRDGDRDYRLLGRRLGEAVGRVLPAQRVLASVPEPGMAPLFEGLRDAGFSSGRDLCLDGEQPAKGSERRWIDEAEGLGATSVGLGTDCFVPGDFVHRWLPPLAAAVNARDRGGSVAKVYYWTLSAKSSMRRVLDLGVDGMVVNDPRALRQVLAEEPYASLYRPAEAADSQFAVHAAP